jgi:hypothetical protein
VLLTLSGEEAVRQEDHEVIKTIWEHYLEYPDYHELSEVSFIEGQRARSRPLLPAAPGGKLVSDGLGKVPAGKWIVAESFLRHLLGNVGFLEVVADYDTLFINDRASGILSYHAYNWTLANGGFCLVVLLEYAATLGLIDIGLVDPMKRGDDLEGFWGEMRNSIHTIKRRRLSPMLQMFGQPTSMQGKRRGLQKRKERQLLKAK